MRRGPLALALALALASALSLACASAPTRPRPLIGRAHLSVVAPLIATQSFTDLAVTLEEGRLISGAALDLLRFQGCLRGTWNTHDVYLCPDAEEPGGARRWRSRLGTHANFAVALEDEGRTLRVEVGRLEMRVALGAGEVGAEVRASPELVGALFALGLPPAARENRYVLEEDPP